MYILYSTWVAQRFSFIPKFVEETAQGEIPELNRLLGYYYSCIVLSLRFHVFFNENNE